MRSKVKKIFLGLALASGISSAQARIEISHASLAGLYDQSHQEMIFTKSYQDRVAFYANIFFSLKTPYLVEPLGEGEQGIISKAPLYRFDAFDCTTFVETVLALAISNKPDDFLIRINQIRYKSGIVAYENRNHFSSLDWIPNNIKNGFVEDVTSSIAGQKTKWSQTWINKGEWFKRKGYQSYLEKSLELAQLPYISKEDLLNSPELVDKIPSGTLFHIVRPNWDLTETIGTKLDISHMGFLIREQGVLYMIHASNGASRDGIDDIKRVKKEPLIEYIKRVMLPSSTTAGINLLAIKNANRLPKQISEIPKNEVVGPGILKPTVYFFPVLDEDKNRCSEGSKKTLYGEGGAFLASVCPRTEEYCSIQGSCGVIQKGKMQSYNVVNKVFGQYRYSKIEDRCQMGYGVKNICLDPYYTVAADLTIYKPGEIIFIPAVVGLELPDGSKHHGFFVIRDKGWGISGYGRFDFFTGKYSWKNPENPFKQLRLGDLNTNIPYYRISGGTAKRVLQSRGFPNLPTKGQPLTSKH